MSRADYDKEQEMIEARTSLANFKKMQDERKSEEPEREPEVEMEESKPEPKIEEKEKKRDRGKDFEMDFDSKIPMWMFMKYSSVA